MSKTYTWNNSCWRSFDQVEPQRSCLWKLPPELRLHIWKLLLLSQTREQPTFGESSGICVAPLVLCKRSYIESLPLLYEANHIIGQPSVSSFMWDQIPPRALRSLRNFTLEIRFRTRNRGDCEVDVSDISIDEGMAEGIVLHLDNSRHLQHLHLELLNESQRKKGPKPMRGKAVYATIEMTMLPFASLPERQTVTVGGFDTIDFVEMWDRLRSEHAGTSLNWLNEIA